MGFLTINTGYNEGLEIPFSPGPWPVIFPDATVAGCIRTLPAYHRPHEGHVRTAPTYPRPQWTQIYGCRSYREVK